MQPTLDFILKIAVGAGELLREQFEEPHQIEYKGVIDLVTEADKKSEEYVIDQIRSKFPHHTIISEESGYLSGQDEHCWYIDPLDGTTNYAHGVPIYAVSIAYAASGTLQAGVIFDPMQNERFSAERDKGAWLNGKRLQVSGETDLNKSMLVTGFPYNIRTAEETNLENFGYFTLRSHAVRRLGSAALDLAYVAAGRLDGYWETSIHPWDIAAGTLMVKEAGGLVTDLTGNPNYMRPPYAVIAAPPAVHAALLAGLNRNDRRPVP